MKNNIIKVGKMKAKIKMLVVLLVVIFTLPIFAN